MRLGSSCHQNSKILGLFVTKQGSLFLTKYSMKVYYFGNDELSIKGIRANSYKGMHVICGSWPEPRGVTATRSRRSPCTIWSLNCGGGYILQSIHGFHPRSVYGRSFDGAKGALNSCIAIYLAQGLPEESGDRRAMNVWIMWTTGMVVGCGEYATLIVCSSTGRTE